MLLLGRHMSMHSHPPALQLCISPATISAGARFETAMDFLVIIRCPRTGEEVPTGRVADITKLDRLPPGPFELTCAACGETHEWSRSDALLAHTLSGLDNWRLEAQPRLELPARGVLSARGTSRPR
jgi:hypothetical protein